MEYQSIGFLSVLLPFVTAIAILLIIFITKHYRDKERNKVIIKAIEAGKDIDPEMFKQPVNPKKADPLTSALSAIGAGAGIFAAFYFFFGGMRFAAFGLIPFFIGIGQLVAYFVNKNKDNTQEIR